MDLRSLKPEQELTTGYVYRRIPNFEAHYDYEESLPEPATFVPRPRDDRALSAHLDEDEARAALAQPLHKGFGLCALDIDAMRRESAGRVRVIFTPGEKKGSWSHVSIYGCTEDEVRVLLAAIAEMVVEPDEPRNPH